MNDERNEMYYIIKKKDLPSVMDELSKFICRELHLKNPIHLYGNFRKSFQKYFSDNLAFDGKNDIYQIQEDKFIEWMKDLQSEIIEYNVLDAVDEETLNMGVNKDGEIVFSLTEKGRDIVDKIQKHKDSSGDSNDD